MDSDGERIDDKVDECGPDCPFEKNAWKTDDTLKFTASLNQREIMIAVKLLGIIASSLLLIGLMVTGLGSQVLKSAFALIGRSPTLHYSKLKISFMEFDLEF